MIKILDLYSKKTIFKKTNRFLIDADLVLHFFLKCHPNSSKIESFFDYFAQLNTRIYITSFAVARLHFYLSLEDPQKSEDALIWLEQNLNIEVIYVDSSSVYELDQNSLENLDCATEEIAAIKESLDAIVTLHPSQYVSLAIPVLSVDEILDIYCYSSFEEKEKADELKQINLEHNVLNDTHVQGIDLKIKLQTLLFTTFVIGVAILAGLVFTEGRNSIPSPQTNTPFLGP